MIGKTKQSTETQLHWVLRKAATDDRTVIITTLNEAWAKPGSIFDIFLESFHIGNGTKQLLEHLVVIAMDSKAFERCKSIHNHCILLTTKGIDFSKEKRYMSHDYVEMMWKRLEFMTSVLDMGYNFIFTDSDIMWFRNPFPSLPPNYHISIASDQYFGSPFDRRNRANCGFQYVRSSTTTVEFFKYWRLSRTLYPGKNEQEIFNIIKTDSYSDDELGLEVNFLDTKYFSGFCEPSKDVSKVCTMHANCCVGMEKKIHDLNVLLEDWKNYTARSQGERKVGGFSWSVPDKCKIWTKVVRE